MKAATRFFMHASRKWHKMLEILQETSNIWEAVIRKIVRKPNPRKCRQTTRRLSQREERLHEKTLGIGFGTSWFPKQESRGLSQKRFLLHLLAFKRSREGLTPLCAKSSCHPPSPKQWSRPVIGWVQIGHHQHSNWRTGGLTPIGNQWKAIYQTFPSPFSLAGTSLPIVLYRHVKVYMIYSTDLQSVCTAVLVTITPWF